MKYKVSLNNKVYEVEVEKGNAILLDEYEAAKPAAPAAAAPAAAPVAAPAAAPAAAPVAVAAGETVPAPLPGKVVDVKVTVGQKVKAGEVLLLIEAMKMENEVMCPRDATIAQIVANKGTAVQSGDPLVVLQ